MPLSTFQTTVMVNLVGSFNVAKAAADLMQHNAPGIDGERGVIVNTASVAAYEGQIGQAAYSASKGGVVAMTLPMARELSRFGIRVVTVAPGIFWTPMVDGMPEDVQKSLSASIPFPSRLGRPEEFAEAVAFILGSRYLNGETLRLDAPCAWRPSKPDQTSDSQPHSRFLLPSAIHESPRNQERQRRRPQRHRVPGARHRAQLAAGPRRQRQVPLHPVQRARRRQVRP
jgi:hypothetical protein